MDTLNISKICRICICESNDTLNIFSSLVDCDGASISLVKVLNVFVATEFIEIDQYPTQICIICIDKAIIAYKFKLQCDRSQEYLQSYVNKFSLSLEQSFDAAVNTLNNNVQDVKQERSHNAEDELLEKRLAGECRREEYDNLVEDCSVDDNYDENLDEEKPKIVLKYDCEGHTIGTLIKTESTAKVIKTIKSKIGKSSKLKLKHKTSGIKAKREQANSLKKIKLKDYENKNPQAGRNIQSDNFYFCTKCNKSFKNKSIFTAHEKRHEFKGQFLCNSCGKGFNSQSCLTRHNRVHTGEKKYECNVCHKKFASSNNLNLHSRTHTGLKPYLCTVCGKKFSHPTGLTYHMRTHTKEKPYGCDLCGKRFAIRCHVDRHTKTHSGERPFPCKECDKAFIKKIDLTRHEAIHSGIKPYSCQVCKKTFLRKMHLHYHMMLHTEERPHTCSFCGKGFIRLYYLKDHISKHHM